MGILKFSPAASALLFCALLTAAPCVKAQEPAGALFEQKIKAGLVYNFLKFTSWPESESVEEKGLKVCIFGDDPFESYLAPLAGRTAQNSLIAISRIDTIGEAGECHLLYIHTGREKDLPSLFAFLRGRHTLTVSDIADFTHKGGMVEFVKENDYISIYINRKTAGAAGLTIQDRLLKLAKSAKS